MQGTTDTTLHRLSYEQATRRGSATAKVFYPYLLFMLSFVIATTGHADDQRIPGKFVWTELITYDVALSQEFYGRLFDWEFDDYNGYQVAWRQDEPIGGIVHRPRQDPEGKSRWIAYISVDNVQQVETAMADAGVEMLAAPHTIDGLGELAVFADDEGALFGVIQGDGPDPGDYLASYGDWIWIQLFSHNADQASLFYQRVGGYERVENPQTPDAFLLVREGYARAVVSTISSRYPDAKPAWVPFLRVADIESTLNAAQALGGKTLVAPRQDLYDNRVAMIEAPDGSAVGILRWTVSDDEEVTP
jgi:uncharacterized protein